MLVGKISKEDEYNIFTIMQRASVGMLHYTCLRVMSRMTTVVMRSSRTMTNES